MIILFRHECNKKKILFYFHSTVTESHLQEPISLNSKKDAFHMPSHPEEKTSSHLERLQQFHTSSLLNQPLKMDAHLKPTTSPGSDIGGGSGDQKHYCHLCQKNFSSTSSLQIHMRTHTGEVSKFFVSFKFAA